MPSLTLVENGTFFDGTGAPGQPRDVLLRDGRVEKIASPGTLKIEDARRIDATTCWVTPGFLDTHTHYDAELALSPGLVESVRHGVTTIVVGCWKICSTASI